MSKKVPPCFPIDDGIVSKYTAIDTDIVTKASIQELFNSRTLPQQFKSITKLDQSKEDVIHLLLEISLIPPSRTDENFSYYIQFKKQVFSTLTNSISHSKSTESLTNELSSSVLSFINFVQSGKWNIPRNRSDLHYRNGRL